MSLSHQSHFISKLVHFIMFLWFQPQCKFLYIHKVTLSPSSPGLLKRTFMLCVLYFIFPNTTYSAGSKLTKLMTIPYRWAKLSWIMFSIYGPVCVYMCKRELIYQIHMKIYTMEPIHQSYINEYIQQDSHSVFTSFGRESVWPSNAQLMVHFYIWSFG